VNISVIKNRLPRFRIRADSKRFSWMDVSQKNCFVSREIFFF